MKAAAPSIEPADPTVCPSCGHQNDSSNHQCSRCGHELASTATGPDVTPYARAIEAGESGWWRMCRWVWGASTGRINHLALMQSSPASRRFAGINLLLFSFAVAAVAAAFSGWRVIRRPLAEGMAAIVPSGRGWLRVTSGKRVSPGGIAAEVQLWWSTGQSVIAAVAGLLAGFLCAWLILLFARRLMELAHGKRYRGERRMTAALAYATAWLVPLLPAALILTLRPLALIGEVRRWAWTPSVAGLLGAAGTLAAVAAMMSWFWMIRLGATAPTDTRGRVVTMSLLVLPAITLAAAIGWWMGLHRALDELFSRANLSF